MLIKTSDPKSIKPFIDKLFIPKPDSHKGQNGKVLVIGGSKLFHSASIWAAEVVSHFVDMVHYSSTTENNEIFSAVKKKFRNGIVVQQKELEYYVEEDDVILLGPGMIRDDKYSVSSIKYQVFEKILNLKNEAEYTFQLTRYLLEKYADKKFVLDAGALQMMEPEWLKRLKVPAIITPHQKEFEQLFSTSVSQLSVDQKAEEVKKKAKQYSCVILMKAVDDYISDGEKTFIVSGGNAGLTKGGTGDVLAGLTAGFYSKNSNLNSCVLASFLLKKTAEELFLQKGYWYNNSDIISTIPKVLKNLYSFI